MNYLVPGRRMGLKPSRVKAPLPIQETETGATATTEKPREILFLWVCVGSLGDWPEAAIEAQ